MFDAGVLSLGMEAKKNSIPKHSKYTTIDGSEIRRSPVELGSLSRYLQGFYTSEVVVWDFWTINSMFDEIYQKKSPFMKVNRPYIEYLGIKKSPPLFKNLPY